MAPKAVLFIFRWGGFAVIPQRYIFSIMNASQVRKTEPILFKLLMLSKIIIKGFFEAVL